MSGIALTDAEIQKLIKLPKKISNPRVRSRVLDKHTQTDYRVFSEDETHEFIVFARQSNLIHNSFTAGLRWLPKSGDSVILVRMNGSSHSHKNSIEKTRIEFGCHIHMATERYMALDKREEAYAEATNEYQTLNGALYHLLKFCNISGLNIDPEERSLFD
jgi:hypothetical protein